MAKRHQQLRSPLLQVNASGCFIAQKLPEAVLIYRQLDRIRHSYQNTILHINENIFTNIVCRMTDMFRPQWVRRSVASCLPFYQPTGPWEIWALIFNIKMSSCQYRKSHCGDKTVARSSYLHNGISYTGKMSSLYWIRALDVILKMQCSILFYWLVTALQWMPRDLTHNRSALVQVMP